MVERAHTFRGSTTQKFGKRVQQFANIQKKTTAEKKTEERQAHRLEQSLQMAHDSRYKEIEFYRDCESGRLDKMLMEHAKGAAPRYYPEPWKMPEPLGSRSCYHRGPTKESKRQTDFALQRLAAGEVTEFTESMGAKFNGRIAWEDSFKANMKQLMVDFNLTTDPDCRLNHLERMHEWFLNEGQKQARKDQPLPQFLTTDKYEQPAPGSTRGGNVAGPVNSLTLGLSTAFKKLPTTERLGKHFGVVPGPPPPGPSYK